MATGICKRWADVPLWALLQPRPPHREMRGFWTPSLRRQEWGQKGQHWQTSHTTAYLPEVKLSGMPLCNLQVSAHLPECHQPHKARDCSLRRLCSPYRDNRFRDQDRKEEKRWQLFCAKESSPFTSSPYPSIADRTTTVLHKPHHTHVIYASNIFLLSASYIYIWHKNEFVIDYANPIQICTCMSPLPSSPLSLVHNLCNQFSMTTIATVTHKVYPYTSGLLTLSRCSKSTSNKQLPPIPGICFLSS